MKMELVKIIIASVCLLMPFAANSQQRSIFASDIFNWRFYLNAHSDLLAAGIFDEAGAMSHWQNFGIRECRRAHPTFHVSQYLDRYRDLKAAYGPDCGSALNHYLTYGRTEKRSGLNGTYYIGPHGSRVTVKNDVIAVGMSSRMAGAVDSIYHNGREYINSMDRGRQMQVAWSVNSTGECNNPAEAGSNSNGINGNSSSNWVSRWETANSAHTTSFPAFWLKPNERADCRNAVQLPGHKLAKHVTVGIPGVSDQLIELISEVTIPAATNHLIVESPALYIAPEFSKFYVLKKSGCTVTPLAGAGGEQGLPIIASISDGGAAIGLWSPDLPSPGFATAGYGRAVFSFAEPINAGVKINAVHRRSEIPAGTYDHQTFVAVGTVNEVKDSLCKAIAAFG